MRHLLYSFILLGMLTPVFFASAAEPIGKFGWMTPATSLVGTASTSCPTGSIEEEFLLVDIETMLPISVTNIALETFTITTRATVDSAMGPGPTIGPVCYNPDTDGIAIYVDGGSTYYNFYISSIWGNPGSVPRGNHIQSTAYLVPTSSVTPDYTHVTPVNMSTSVNQEYKIDTSRMPLLHGATDFRDFLFFLSKYDFNTNTFNNVVSQYFSATGGVGLKTIPAQSLSDGWYQWSYYLSLNGTASFVPGLSILYMPVSGWSLQSWPFLYDTTPPIVQTITHTPSPVYETDQVQITGEANDALAGVTEMVLYLDGVPVHTCPFMSVQTAQCQVTAGPFLAGTNHSYFLVSTDGVGLISTSTTGTFDVLGTPLPNIVVSSNAPADGYSVLDSEPSIVFSGVAENTNTLPVTEGGWADLEIDWNSDGGAMGAGGDTFDVNLNAFNSLMLGAFALLEQKAVSYEVVNPPTGTHRYRFTADVTNQLLESDEDDNHSAWRTFIVAASPDQCVGVVPTSAQACSAALPSGSAPYILVDRCTDWTNPSMCVFECLAGYIKDTGGSCVLAQCNDGVDNADTEDVLVDMADAGCANISDNDESDFSPALTATARVVNEGDPVTISWDTNNGNESLCTLTGPGIVGNPLAPSAGDPEIGDITVNIYGLSTYTLTCAGQSTTLRIEIISRGWDS